jgi:protein-disulfide isomerase
MEEAVMKRVVLLCWALTFAIVVSRSHAAAEPPECTALQGARHELAAKILQSQHAYACCDSTLKRCLEQRPACRVVERLARDVCRRVAAGQDRASIERGLARRATSMLPSAKRYSIAVDNMPAAGDPSAPVTAVLYLCPRCPYCARMAPALYKEVTQGALKGKVKLYIRPFPLRSHSGSTEGAMAWMAAIRLGSFWPYALRLYAEFDNFDPKRLPELARACGMDREEFTKLLKDKTLRSALVESKKEGVRNGVDATPTLFINGRKYVGDLDAVLVADVLAEEYDAVTGKTR